MVIESDHAESDDSYSSCSSSSSNRNPPVHPTFATPKGRIFLKNYINLSPATSELLFCINFLLKCSCPFIYFKDLDNQHFTFDLLLLNDPTQLL